MLLQLQRADAQPHVWAVQGIDHAVHCAIQMPWSRQVLRVDVLSQLMLAQLPVCVAVQGVEQPLQVAAAAGAGAWAC